MSFYFKMEQQKPKFIKLRIAGGVSSIIPPGVTESLTIKAIDGNAVFHFQDCKITKAFAEGQKKDGVESLYSERLKKTICRYPGMSQDEILKHISTRLKILAKKGK